MRLVLHYKLDWLLVTALYFRYIQTRVRLRAQKRVPLLCTCSIMVSRSTE